MNPFTMQRDINGYNGFGIRFSDTVFRTTLEGGATPVAQNFTVPPIPNGNYNEIMAVFVFNPGSNVFVGYNTTATIPGGSFVQLSHVDFKPAGRTVYPGDVLSFITPDDNAYVNVLLYAVRN